MLITPESLESLLINHREWCVKNFANLEYFIIDEFHAFIGTERGYQLLSQLHRIEIQVKHSINRIALSATLNNIKSVQNWLRTNSSRNVEIIENNVSQKKILIQIRGYDFKNSVNESKDGISEYDVISKDLFKLLRGDTNLVFSNSRSKTEYISTTLTQMSQENFVPNEFFPHHGSLDKKYRIQLESRLKEGKLPTTAICTQTLELGIDIGDVSTIAQVDAPQSVASLRQRIGRSGRREKDAVLRLFIPEVNRTEGYNSLYEKMRDQTFLSISMIDLVLNHWFEPPVKKEYAFSTLIQQILSVIAQYGSVKAINLWKLLCQTGPFNLVTPEIFGKLLKALGSKDLIVQMRDKSLTLGVSGEQLVSKFNFYSSFKAQEEFTIETNNQKIGVIPLNQPLSIGDTFLFAGKGWEVVFFNSKQHQISVKPYKDTTSPLVLDGNSGKIHDGVREKMFNLYKTDEIPLYLNKIARRHFLEGQKQFKELDLATKKYIFGIDGIYLFPWKGDKIMHTIVQILKIHGISSKKLGSFIHIAKTSIPTFQNAVKEILQSEPPKEIELAKTIKNLEFEKFDSYLTEELLQLGYSFSHFDVEGAMQYFAEILDVNPFNATNNAAYITI